ncbi:DUF2844 domain-containing protein [Paraburkholderia sp. PREW-6R]|uniref:DUF2844 domain-containing protein n=1 Tax=Paraburkholderia sp. PREW-6R TaxID=3141544 RepID=UPI0031F53A6B
MPDSLFSLSAASLTLVCLTLVTDAHAELGGTMPTSAVSHAAAPTASLNGALRVRTFTDTGKTTINEYATSTGQIVAYTWQGPTMPDLRALLGNYADSFRAGAAALPADGNLHIARVARPDVIVETGGPMRSYVGRAWLPGALPAGVTADDLR